MEKIALPKKVEFNQDSKSNNGFVVVEPFYPGYGMTLGNSLRRVLLSSLPGAAVVGVKIKGVKHEFMSLSGVKEDIVDIILNLKQLRLKIFADTEEPIKLELNVKGKKQITAADIQKNSQVEIVNQDLVLANTTEAISNLSMEIYVAKGRGYLLVERNKKEIKEIDYIEIDSIFSPVLAVSAKVENVRVGKMTNWDKLILDIETDGTISVKEAFDNSVSILIEQFKSLSMLDNDVEIKVEAEDAEPVLEKVEIKSKVKAKAKVLNEEKKIKKGKK
ncbi:DNA-directed RNA polymerase subunit alpha [Candidatus Falkowbacteria bacterium HGW-Falkowbacteria-1]|uniref:DNA-directed RNA polymerase subunit alpha n=1 Tax=Candidatus Falkowbacteria bacterium HGW-Falkowbacteria-1 TaxID=2013768 RepID=A0A2N2E9U1_9BACT|nr:MAG: DNA-directed RNA polymerase subunit alpha [Candidatus Falkowbacteria bacterium HGW-Falkowbacteria-1]